MKIEASLPGHRRGAVGDLPNLVIIERVAHALIAAERRGLDSNSAITMREKIARSILAKVPQGYGMTASEALDYADATLDELTKPTLSMIGAVVDHVFGGSIEDANLISQIISTAMIAARAERRCD